MGGGGKAVVISKEAERRSVQWLYEESIRKKALREAKAEEERQKEIDLAAGSSSKRRLGKGEQHEMVKRLEQHALRKREREAAAAAEEEATRRVEQALGERDGAHKQAMREQQEAHAEALAAAQEQAKQAIVIF